MLKERPNDPNFLFYKASCLERSGQWKEAKNLFLKITPKLIILLFQQM